MTDNVPPGANGTGEGGDGAQPQPWFPPAGEPGGYGQPPPFEPGQGPSSGGFGQPAGGSGQPGYAQPGGYPPQGPGQPGYGPPRGPGQPPAYPVAEPAPQAPKPGVIPLRPLGVGELLDGAFTSIRRNPRATLGIAALLLTASAVITTTLSLILVHYVGSVTLPTPGEQLTTAQATRLLTRMGEVLAPTAAVSLVLAFIVDTVLTGLLTVVIGRSVLGHKITAGEAWRIARPRMAALIGATLLIPLILIGIWAVYVIVLVILAVAARPGRADRRAGRAGSDRRDRADHLVHDHVPDGGASRGAGTGGPGPGARAVLAAGPRQLLAGVRHHVAGRADRGDHCRGAADPVQPVRGDGRRWQLAAAQHRRERGGHPHQRGGRCRGRCRGAPDLRRGGRPALRRPADAPGGPRPGPADRGGRQGAR